MYLSGERYGYTNVIANKKTNMNYERRIVCFIDILGFKNHIDETVNDMGNEDVVEKINSIITAINLSKKILYDDVIKSKMVTQFSDSIVISFKIEEESGVFFSLLDLLHLSFELAFKGYLIRGGVVYGKLIHTEDFVFGPGLNAAYLLESKEAKYPRIVIDPSVLLIGKTFPLSINSANEEEESILKIVKTDSDKRLYIDYINGAYTELDEANYTMIKYLRQLSSLVKKGYEQNILKDERVNEKLDWLKDKVNATIREFSSGAKKIGIIDGDEKLTQEYMNLEEIE